jgi:hypothetical protein
MWATRPAILPREEPPHICKGGKCGPPALPYDLAPAPLLPKGHEGEDPESYQP